MSELDLLVRGGLAALPGRMEHADLGVHLGRIVAIGPNLDYRAAAILEASGLILLPAMVDSAVRLGGYAEGTAALAEGGAATFADLPGTAGNARPVFDRDDFARKRAEAEASSLLDFALWAAVSSRNLYELGPLRDCGAVGFHAVLAMADAGDIPALPPRLLGLAMKQVAKLKRPLCVQVEGPEGEPEAAELERIAVALDLAGETGCALHLAPLRAVEGAALVAAAREKKIDVTLAAAPRHVRLPGFAAAWREGRIDLLGSGARGGGLADARRGFADLCAEAALAPQEAVPLHEIAARACGRAAERLGLQKRKGTLAVGMDADFSLLDLDEAGPDLRAPGRIVRTMRRGETVFANGRAAGIANAGAGCFIRP